MSLNVFHSILSATIAMATGLLTAGTAPIEPFNESFEGKQLYPYWTLSQQSGTIKLTLEQAYSGSQSLKFASVPGANRFLYATHYLSRPTKGTVSIAFFDVAPGQETLYEGLQLSNSLKPDNIAVVGTQDFDANCYKTYVGSGGMGPGANCGIYPQSQTTPVKRTAGWHKFSIHFDVSSVSIAIDGTVIYTALADYEFDTIVLTVSGPSWRPDTVAYFDDFSFSPLPSYIDRWSKLPGRLGVICE